jgi:hypothetical protein
MRIRHPSAIAPGATPLDAPSHRYRRAIVTLRPTDGPHCRAIATLAWAFFISAASSAHNPDVSMVTVWMVTAKSAWPMGPLTTNRRA